MGKICCFIGHRMFNVSKFKEKLTELVERLIAKEGVSTFLFGSRSEFNYECFSIVKDLKEKYNHIKLVYVRAEMERLTDVDEVSILGQYDETYFSSYAINAGKYCYIRRNEEMIDKSDYCVFYYNPEYIKKRNVPTNSGTEIAYNYAKSMNKEIINIYN